MGPVEGDWGNSIVMAWAGGAMSASAVGVETSGGISTSSGSV